jgi:hypothetical protein
MKLKIRPFKTTVEGVQFEGVIEGEQLRLRLFRHTYPITTAEVGVDERGPFALIGQMQRPVEFGYKLLVEAEYDEDFPGVTHCCIAIIRDKTDSVRALLQEEGIKPDSVNLVGTVTESVDIYFQSDGTIESPGCSERVPSIIGDYDM